MDDEYITREDAMWAACKALCHPGARCPDNCCIEVRKVFNAIPAADVRPVVRGRWIGETVWSDRGINVHAMRECNNCHKVRVVDNFCTNCGADMREDG